MTIPHCPNPRCQCFSTPRTEKWYHSIGFHPTKTFGPVPRFRCKLCRKTFSTQTFSIDYCANKIIDYNKILQHISSASGNIDMARILGCSVETVQNRIERLAHTAMAVQQAALGHLPLQEPLVYDGLESFSYSQFYPHHLNISAGADSQFIYTLDFANLRRKGSMTQEQKEKRAQLEKGAKADKKGIEKSTKRTLDRLRQLMEQKGLIRPLVLRTDQHQAYPRALQKHPIAALVQHESYSSKAPRTTQNPLFAVNYVDRQIRKDLSDHTRETVQFAKHPGAMMARCWVYLFAHNFHKPYRIKRMRMKDEHTHSEEAGLGEDCLKRILGQYQGKRVFYNKLGLGEGDSKSWFFQCNPGMESGRYQPKYYNL